MHPEARNVSRCHDERESERGFPARKDQWNDQFKFDRRFFARRDIADPHRKSIGAFFFNDRRPMSLRDGAVVITARFTTLFDDSFDNTFADIHTKPMHGAAIRQRKDVGRLDRLIEVVHKSLLERRPRKKPAYRGVHVQRLQGQIAAAGRERAETWLRKHVFTVIDLLI